MKTRVLNILHVGRYMYGGGAERWLRMLVANLDPNSIIISKSYIIGSDFFNPDFAAQMGIPVSVASGWTIFKEAPKYDAVIYWGPVPMNRYLFLQRPLLCVFCAFSLLSRPSLLMGDHVVDAVLAVGDRVKETVCHDFDTDVWLQVVDPSLLQTTITREKMRERLGFNEKDFVIGAIGWFSDTKRTYLILEALKHLPSFFKGLLIGGGPDLQLMRQKARLLGEGRVVVSDFVDNIGDIYQALDALVFPSALSGEAGIPLAVTEAMWFGVPVIVTPVAEIPFILKDGIDSIFLNNEETLVADIINSVLEISKNPKFKSSLSEEAKATVYKLGSPRDMAYTFEKFIWRNWERKKFNNTY